MLSGYTGQVFSVGGLPDCSCFDHGPTLPAPEFFTRFPFLGIHPFYFFSWFPHGFRLGRWACGLLLSLVRLLRKEGGSFWRSGERWLAVVDGSWPGGGDCPCRKYRCGTPHAQDIYLSIYILEGAELSMHFSPILSIYLSISSYLSI